MANGALTETERAILRAHLQSGGALYDIWMVAAERGIKAGRVALEAFVAEEWQAQRRADAQAREAQEQQEREERTARQHAEARMQAQHERIEAMMVYFALDAEGGIVKIGTSTNPRRRVEKEIRTDNPRAALYAVMPGGWDEENELHARFSSLCLMPNRLERGREWFRYEDPLRSFVEEMRDRYPLPGERLFVRDEDPAFKKLTPEHRAVLRQGSTLTQMERLAVEHNIPASRPTLARVLRLERGLLCVTAGCNGRRLDGRDLCAKHCPDYVPPPLVRDSQEDERRARAEQVRAEARRLAAELRTTRERLRGAQDQAARLTDKLRGLKAKTIRAMTDEQKAAVRGLSLKQAMRVVIKRGWDVNYHTVRRYLLLERGLICSVPSCMKKIHPGHKTCDEHAAAKAEPNPKSPEDPAPIEDPRTSLPVPPPAPPVVRTPPPIRPVIVGGKPGQLALFALAS